MLAETVADTDGQTLRILKHKIIIATSVGDASSVGDGLASWPVTVGVVEVGVVDTRYGVSHPGADAKR